MHIVCSDLEGVFIPEIWINVAERTGIEELRLTTRDISDYDVLMKRRLAILADNGLKLKDITDAVAGMDPLPGARDFLDWLRARTQVIIVSDTYLEFARPLMEKLGWPTLLCHGLTVDDSGCHHRLQPPADRRQTQGGPGLQKPELSSDGHGRLLQRRQHAQRGPSWRPCSVPRRM